MCRACTVTARLAARRTRPPSPIVGCLPGAPPLDLREGEVSSYESSPGKLRRFCSLCGSRRGPEGPAPRGPARRHPERSPSRPPEGTHLGIARRPLARVRRRRAVLRLHGVPGEIDRRPPPRKVPFHRRRTGAAHLCDRVCLSTVYRRRAGRRPKAMSRAGRARNPGKRSRSRTTVGGTKGSSESRALASTLRWICA